MNTLSRRVALAVALTLPTTLSLADNAGTEELLRRIEALQRQYESRIAALEARIRDLETAASRPAASKAATAVPSAPAESPAAAAVRRENPALSLVLQGGAASYSQPPESLTLPGMPLGGEAGLREEGLSLWEAELTASATIDPLFFGRLTLGMHVDEGETELDIEEAFVDTLALPAGLGLRFGRFYSAAGYLNAHHTHAWDFADAPLAYRAFFGDQYADDGLRLSWLAPGPLYLDLDAELLRGDRFPGGGNRGGAGAVRGLSASLGGDAGTAASWQLGLSQLHFDVAGRMAAAHAHGADTAGPAFTGDSRLTLIDAVLKADLDHRRALILQAEYLRRHEDGRILIAEDSGDALLDYEGRQNGWYLQGVYRLDRRWGLGLRYDRLQADNRLAVLANATGEGNDEILEESGYLDDGRRPDRWTAMIDWSPSEFSRLRLQYARDRSRHRADDQFLLQYIMSLGAHAAHPY